LKTDTGMATRSPRTSEYGRVNETKNGWNAVTLNLSDTPTPDVEPTQKPLPTHSVIVCGTVTGTCFSVWPLSINQSNDQLAIKTSTALSVSTKLLHVEPG